MTKPEHMRGMTGYMMKRGFGRTIEEQRGPMLEESLRFLGLEIKKGEEPIETIKRIVEQINKSSIDLKDIVGGIDDGVNSIKRILADPNPQQKIDEIDRKKKGE